MITNYNDMPVAGDTTKRSKRNKVLLLALPIVIVVVVVFLVLAAFVPRGVELEDAIKIEALLVHLQQLQLIANENGGTRVHFSNLVLFLLIKTKKDSI